MFQPDHIDLEPWQVAEITRCIKSPEYFVETFCWLQQEATAGISETSGIIPFELGTIAPTKEQIAQREVPDEAHFHFQRRILRDLLERKNVLTKKSRRVGCSWIAAAYVAWLINFFQGVQVIFISLNEDKAKKILAKVDFILKNLAYHDHENIDRATSASWLCGYIAVNNSQLLSIGWRSEDGVVSRYSSAASLTTTDNTARGDGSTFMVFDELAFYEHPDETWSAATKTIARGGHWMAISTVGGIGDVFHRLCSLGDLAEQGKLVNEEIQFAYHTIHWSEAGLTQDDIAKASIGDSQEKINQEWEMEFIVPGTVVFNPTNLAACYKPPDLYPEIAAYLAEYKEQVALGQRMYFGGVDTIKGNITKKSREKDWNSAIFITDAGVQAHHEYNQQEISQWAGGVKSGQGDTRVEVPGTVSELHKEYPGPLWIEQDGPGLVVVTNHILPRDKRCDKHPVDMRHEFKFGAVERMAFKIDHQEFIITDLFTYQCFMVFQKGAKVGTYAAPSGYNDDPVISAILANEALEERRELKVKWGKQVTAVGAGEYVQESAVKLPTAPRIQYEIPEENRRLVDRVDVPGPDTRGIANLPYLQNKFKELTNQIENPKRYKAQKRKDVILGGR